MINPYEDESSLEEINPEVLPIDVNIGIGTNQQQQVAPPNETLIADNTIVESSTEEFDLSTRAGRRAKIKASQAEAKIWKAMPEGPEKDSARNEWSLKYKNKTWEEYNNRGNLVNALQQNSAVFNPDFADHNRAIATGTADFFLSDLPNLITERFGVTTPRLPKMDSESAEALRNVSSLVVPFYILRGRSIQSLQGVHASGTAAPWLVRLGNNPWFARMSKFGLDLGIGGFTDGVNKINRENETLASHWKKNRFWGHQLIPDSAISDGKSPDEILKDNVLEGMTLSFYTDIGLGFLKLIKGGRSVDGTLTKYLSETKANQKTLNEITIDPLDTKIYKNESGETVDPITEALMRSDEKAIRDKEKLVEFTSANGKTSENAVDVLTNDDALNNGQITKTYAGILDIARQQAQIATNTGTKNGALGSMLTEAFRKFGTLPDEVANRTILKALKNDLLMGKKYSVELPTGEKLPWSTIDREGTILAEVISDPTLPRGELVNILNGFKTEVNGFKKANKIAYDALTKAQKNLLADWTDINTHKTLGYLFASEASQISGISEGTRKANGLGITKANELILDRLELFEVESQIAKFQWGKRNSIFESLRTNPKNVSKDLKSLQVDFDQKLSEIIPNAKSFRQNLEWIQENSPEFADSFRLAYELSEGNVQSIRGLNKYIQNNFGIFSKMIRDDVPEIPSLFNKALSTNIFNSMLSAVGTPLKALYGNFGGFIAEPAHVFYGALRTGDLTQLRRSSHMYFGLTETFQKGLQYASRIYRKASVDPEDVSKIFRADVSLDVSQEAAKSRELAKSFAKAASTKGEHGPQTILNIVNELDDLGRNPWLRFGPNAMSGLDGFTQATQKVAQDRGLTFDYLLEKYPNGKWSKKEWDDAYTHFSKKGWDADGNISQSAVDYSRREIALNLDTELTKRLNPLIKRYPILRSIFWFPNTQMNALNMFGKYSPRIGTKDASLGFNFANDYSELFGPYGTRSVDSFDVSEIQAILSKRGIDMSGDYMAKFKHLRYKIQGRIATGNLAVMSAGILFTQDRIRGDGHWDRKVQKVRDNQGYVRRTFKGLDGKWHSYDFLGPMADWVAMTVNVMDNFDSVSTNTLEKFNRKMSFILAAGLTKKSLLGNMEPLFQVLSGNEAAVARWAGSLMNATTPLGGLRNELGKLMYGDLREVEKGDIGQMMRNRNHWADIIDPTNALPKVVDWVSGKPVNKHGGTFWHRVKNTYLPIKSYEAPTKEGQFLIDIEYNAMPHLNVADGGIPYSAKEKAELGTLIGEDGGLKKEIQNIMRRAKHMEYTTDSGKTIKGYENILRHLRSRGYSSEDLPEFGLIKTQLDIAIRDAVNRIENQISTINEIEQKRYEKLYKKEAGKREDVPSIDRILQLNNN